MSDLERQVREFAFIVAFCSNRLSWKLNVNHPISAWGGKKDKRVGELEPGLIYQFHGVGCTFEFEGDFRRVFSCEAVSVDYDRSGNIILEPWHIHYFLTERAVCASKDEIEYVLQDAAWVRRFADQCAGIERQSYIFLAH
ncbi:DUF6896 domain-containing protein [Cognatiyoonia sp. IB215182]|uniref:DUF6896 domain-containing protein n=1 Tax=Cognatiyoonia sp. IB215182 TaxID=3097353 RepID=UPI002A0D8250|nr:hypothetical protein [Cognatiyoonia sp. IB215182]MDX8352365.1 hypothetical protein [Cognatiyoonia sp. IB215182]